ncbi:uridine diphosphate glucose pyrophosphatase NUDT22 [Aplysia californica]|uniref:Uridine diphosphate glucose pyrophosphatase NUDT22 n=1 Tax=Aplysia californica TaxID=6500 RepID=A0ABM0JZR9_APLCA|nr:uridine diphosphate glucose pyrophosphatase NUDT22 [Aplysia californica]
MDPHVEVMHVIHDGAPKLETKVQAQPSPTYNRRKDSPTEIAIGNSMIDNIWAERQQKNPRLFNGTKFRLHGVRDSGTSGEIVELLVGVTDYKEYLGTNWSPKVNELKEDGQRLHNNSQTFLSDALGVGAFVVTKDNCMILQRRSPHLAEASGLWDVPGGHAEPCELVGDLSLLDIDVSSMCGKEVVHEIFSSILREVVDEVNIPAECLEPPRYLGTAKNTSSAGRPSMVFEIRSTLTCDEVLARYNEGNQSEADESTNITFKPVNTIHNLQTEDPQFWSSMAPSAKGNITVYCLAYGLRTF